MNMTKTYMQKGSKPVAKPKKAKMMMKKEDMMEKTINKMAHKVTKGMPKKMKKGC